MLNNVILVGRLIKINEERESITIRIQEKEQQDILVEVFVNDKMYNSINDCCKVNSILGIKGKLVATEEQVRVQAQKISFLQSN